MLALWHGTFIFIHDPYYGWYLSATATLLFISYFLHNVVAWLKIRPFLPPWGSKLYIITLLCVQPFWVAEAWSNFSYFNSLGSDANVRMRPWEALVRDPWWIFTTWKLVSAIKQTYGFRILTLCRINSRFGIMLLCMFLSIAFLVTDVLITALHLSASAGINPYWRFALVFKCASDTIFLDDFKSVLDAIVYRKFSSASVNGHVRRGSAVGSHDGRKRSHSGGGEEYIECASAPSPSFSSPEPGPSNGKRKLKSRFLDPFRRAESEDMVLPVIRVERETVVREEMRQTSPDSRRNLRPPQQAHTVYTSRNSAASESDGSLLIGRLV